MKNFSKNSLFLGLIVFLIFCILIYMVARAISVFFLLKSTPTAGLPLLFFLAETFFLIHSIGYMSQVYRVLASEIKEGKQKQDLNVDLKQYPPVAIVLASYKEPLSVIKDTLTCFYNLTYPNKYLYLLDDTRYDKPWDKKEVVDHYKKALEDLCQWMEVDLFRRNWHDAKAGIINDFLKFQKGDTDPSFIHIQNQTTGSSTKPKYLLIFDADMNPFPDFVEALVAQMEEDPKLAFIQTPQYYTNFKTNRVAKGSSLMQVVFYEYICEAKGKRDLMICCGTNVILRIQALEEIGGFDLSSVTEDFATSFNLHQNHWKSAYKNKVCAFGLGPEDLSAFFKQQFRWATGTCSLFPKMLKTLISNRKKTSLLLVWEYFLSSTYYFVGWVYFILMLGPILYLLFDLNIYSMDPLLYCFLIIPYFLLSTGIFYATLIKRNYRFQDIFLGTVLNLISFPVYMKASLTGTLGLKTSFVVTPKGVFESLSLFDLWPQVTLALLMVVSIVFGTCRLYFEGEPFAGILINTLWCLYYFCILSTIFYFNRSKESFD